MFWSRKILSEKLNERNLQMEKWSQKHSFNFGTWILEKLKKDDIFMFLNNLEKVVRFTTA